MAYGPGLCVESMLYINMMFKVHFSNFLCPRKMLYKVFLIYVALTQICGTSLDSNGEVRQNITLEKCKILQIQMIEWRRDSLIIITIIIVLITRPVYSIVLNIRYIIVLFCINIPTIFKIHYLKIGV